MMFAEKRPALVGAGFALASLPAHFMLSAGLSQQLAAIVLAVVAGIYVGFALQDGRARILVTEGCVAFAFIAASLAGLWLSPWAIPVAYALHGFWDLAHHRYVSTAMPAWYVPFCAIFDFVFAAGLVIAWMLA